MAIERDEKLPGTGRTAGERGRSRKANNRDCLAILGDYAKGPTTATNTRTNNGGITRCELYRDMQEASSIPPPLRIP